MERCRADPRGSNSRRSSNRRRRRQYTPGNLPSLGAALVKRGSQQPDFQRCSKPPAELRCTADQVYGLSGTVDDRRRERKSGVIPIVIIVLPSNAKTYIARCCDIIAKVAAQPASANAFETFHDRRLARFRLLRLGVTSMAHH